MSQFYSFVVPTQGGSGWFKVTGELDVTWGVRMIQSPSVRTNLGNMFFQPLPGGKVEFIVTFHNASTNHRFTLRKMNGPDDCLLEQHGLAARGEFSDTPDVG
jgi:hypothetical protein